MQLHYRWRANRETLGRTLGTLGSETRKRRRRTSRPPGTNLAPSRPRRRPPSPQSPSQAQAPPPRSMSRKVTSQVPPARPPRSLRAPLPRRPPPPPNLRTHRGKGKVRTLQKSPSRPPQFEKKKDLAMAGSPLCHLLQMAAFPRCAKLKAAPLRRRSGPLRNLQEVGRGQVAEREVEETILTRSPGLRGSLSSKFILITVLSFFRSLFR